MMSTRKEMTSEMKYDLLKEVVKFVGNVNSNFTDTREMIVKVYREWKNLLKEE